MPTSRYRNKHNILGHKSHKKYVVVIGFSHVCGQIAWLTYAFSSEISDAGVNTLRPRQHGRHFPDDTVTYIFLNENVIISLNFSLKIVLKVRINNIQALVQIMAGRQPGDKPLSEPMVVYSLTHICVTRPQWVNKLRPRQHGRHCPDDVFKYIFLNENVIISVEFSLKFVPKGPIDNIPALVHITA